MPECHVQAAVLAKSALQREVMTLQSQLQSDGAARKTQEHMASMHSVHCQSGYAAPALHTLHDQLSAFGGLLWFAHKSINWSHTTASDRRSDFKTCCRESEGASEVSGAEGASEDLSQEDSGSLHERFQRTRAQLKARDASARKYKVLALPLNADTQPHGIQRMWPTNVWS